MINDKLKQRKFLKFQNFRKKFQLKKFQLENLISENRFQISFKINYEF